MKLTQKTPAITLLLLEISLVRREAHVLSRWKVSTPVQRKYFLKMQDNIFMFEAC